MTRTRKKAQPAQPRTKSDPELPPGVSAGERFAVYDATLARYATVPLSLEEAEAAKDRLHNGHDLSVVQV